jgi:uroporphyrinogen decarboxylase
MTHRERWQRTMHFLKVDYLPDEEFGYWTDTLSVWHHQGLPSWVRTNEQADLFFGFSPRAQAPVAVGLKPAFRARTLEETEHHRIVVDGNGVKCLVHKDGTSSIPKYLEFPVRDRASWNRFRRRLDPETPGRYPRPWKSLVRQWEKRDYPLGISMGSLFGWIRNWAGFEGVAVMVYDDPGLFEEIMEHITRLVLGTIEKALCQVRFDFAACWEDMCFNHGPIISPAMFERYMVPRYCRLTEALRAHGVDIVYVDCDGNIDQLVPLWLEAGVNCMFPLEVAAGSDGRRYRDLYGERVLLMGGIDKRALIEGKQAIEKELRRVEGLARAGGYIPHVDHRVPPDVTYANYCYYLEAKRDRFGIPAPGPWVERVENPARR